MTRAVLLKAVRTATGGAFATVLLASPLYADGNEQTRDATTTMECQRYSGAERTDCERRASQNRMSQEQMSEEQTEGVESATATQRDTSRTSTRSDRTRVSRADTERTSDEGDRESRDPGETQGADMRSAPNPNYDRADEDVSDPYDTGPATETGSDRDSSSQDR